MLDASSIHGRQLAAAHTRPQPILQQQQQHQLAAWSSRSRRVATCWAAAGNGTSHHHHHSNGSNGSSSQDVSDEDRVWQQLAFPSYLQSRQRHKPDVCRDFDRAVTAAERRQARGVFASSDEEADEEGADDDELLEPETVWHTIRREAERDAAAEPLLSSFLYASILAHDSFARALAFVLSNRLANAVMLPTQLFEIFHEVLVSEPAVREGALADVEACRERDPACTSYSQALLYYKGYHAIQTHRIAHALWQRGQKVMATALQSRMSEVLAVDIHPAAVLGRGILLDHGTGVVIGETAVIGNNVSLLQNVTLGGTGKQHGDRHPKISDNVLIGACATVLGNIRVGEGAQIAAGSLVLKPVQPHTMVAGSPAKVVGHITGNPAEKMQQWSKKLLTWDPFYDTQQQQPSLQEQPQQQQQPEQPEQQQQQHTAALGSASAAAAAASLAAAQPPPPQEMPPLPLPTPSKLTIAAAEAAWDAAAARMTGGSSDDEDDSWRQRPSPSASAAAPSRDAGQRTTSSSSTEPAASSSSSSGGVTPGSTNEAQPTAQPAAQPAAAARRTASPGVLGVHAGPVDATVDEEVAVQKWPVRRADPEYVI